MIILDLKTRFNRILERSKHLPGKLVSRQLTYIVDGEIISLFVHMEKEFQMGEKICLVALGGYGRMELTPFSDIDLLYLHDNLEESILGKVINRINTFLYDEGKDVGHACRTISECRQYLDDLKSFNALLDSRLLVGSEKLFDKYKKELLENLPAELAEEYRNIQIEKLKSKYTSDSPMLLSEPDIKNSPFGLRDVQTVYWIEKSFSLTPNLGGFPIFSRGEVQLLEDAYDFLLRLRINMHVIKNRKTDRLDLTLQPEIAEYLGFGKKSEIPAIEKLMNLLYSHQKEIYSFIGLYLDYKIRPSRKFKKEYHSMEMDLLILDDMLYPPRIGNIFSNPEFLYRNVMEVFYILARENLELSPILGNQLKFASNFLEQDFVNSKAVIDIFLKILSEAKYPGRILTEMHHCNILGKLIPEFGACANFSLFSYHHQYTVDEHTLFILRELDKLINNVFDDKEVQEEFFKCKYVNILILAILIHDAGKVKHGDHCQYGAELANSIGERLGLSDDEIGVFKFLVEQHIYMSELTSKRDIKDPELINQFSRVVGDMDRLRLLYVMTTIDTKSVGPGVLTNWKKSILRTLFTTAYAYMETSSIKGAYTYKDIEIESLKNYLISKENISGSIIQNIIQYTQKIIPNTYLRYNTPRRVLYQYSIYQEFLKKKFSKIMIEFEEEPAYITMTTYSEEDRFLLSDITGSISSEALSVISMRSYRAPGNFMINQVQITDSFGSGDISEEKLGSLKEHIEDVTLKKINVEKLLSNYSGWGDFKKIPEGMVEEKIEFDNNISSEYTVLEIRLPDSLGLLYRIIRQILTFDAQIYFVRVATSADYAYDSFYIKSSSGNKIEDNELLKIMEEKIGRAAREKIESGFSYIQL